VQTSLGRGDLVGHGGAHATLLSVLRTGGHPLVGDGLYGGTDDFLTDHAEDLGWRCSFVDMHRPGTWVAARTPETKVFLVETITQPIGPGRRVGRSRRNTCAGTPTL
jgi:O-acetylhomoserine/O-acetylserine sulfhydrylase-like pyridoxal-dependent enzyme